MMIRCALILTLAFAVPAAAQPALSEKAVDAVFSRWTTSTPG